MAALLWLAFHESAVGKCLLTIVGMAALGVAFVVGMPVLNAALNSGWWLPIALPLLATPIVLSAFWWIAAPTTEGRKVLDHIAGFKQYLSITERERLDRMTPPKDTPELFEKFLPYAIALGGREPLGGAVRGRPRRGLGAGAAGLCLVFGIEQPVEQSRRLCRQRRLVAVERGRLGVDRAGRDGSGGGGSSGGGGGGGGGGGWY